jgi:hypothetical protein
MGPAPSSSLLGIVILSGVRRKPKGVEGPIVIEMGNRGGMEFSGALTS